MVDSNNSSENWAAVMAKAIAKPIELPQGDIAYVGQASSAMEFSVEDIRAEVTRIMTDPNLKWFTL